jgi:hypothetical protein
MLAIMTILPATDRARGPAIQVQGLEKAYKKLRVLRGVDFEVGAGQHLRPAHCRIAHLHNPVDAGQDIQAVYLVAVWSGFEKGAAHPICTIIV